MDLRGFAMMLPVVFSVILPVVFPVAALANDQAVIQNDPAYSIEKLCQELTTYHSDGSAEYVAGQDVHGRKVVPADLESGNNRIEPRYPLKIAITFDQAKQFNLAPDIGYTPQMFIGMVELHKDGSVYFDGKRISQPQTQFLCDSSNKKTTKPAAE